MTTKIRTAEEHLALLEHQMVELLRGEADPGELAAIRAIIDGYRSNGISNPDRSSPETVISRVLSILGLTRGQQFRVRSHSGRRDGRSVKIGVRVLTWDMPIEAVLAEHRERIEAMTWAMGHPFQVVTHETRGGQTLVDLSHEIQE